MLEWHNAPLRTQWGKGMKEALVELSKDETAYIYAHEGAISLVEKVIKVIDVHNKINSRNARDLLEKALHEAELIGYERGLEVGRRG